MVIDAEIINDFRSECNALLKELVDIIEKIEDAGEGADPKMFGNYAQVIDRIMGAAKTIGVLEPANTCFTRIGKIAEICKYVGYKAAEKQNPKLNAVLVAFFFDSAETVSSILSKLESPQSGDEVAKSYASVLENRLHWMSNNLAPEIANFSKQFR